MHAIFYTKLYIINGCLSTYAIEVYITDGQRGTYLFGFFFYKWI